MLARIPILSAGKTFTEPLLLVLTALIVLLFLMMRRTTGGARRLAIVAMLLAIGLWILATPLAAGLIVASLYVDPDSDAIPPDVIVVASGGVSHGPNAEYDVPSYSSSARVTAGVQWWRQHRTARLVFAGVDSWPGITAMRSLEVMRDRAVTLGVPPSVIELEHWSTSTREHPLGLLRLRGITRDTRVGVVTSAWHMRRTASEFRRHFRHVIAHPVPPRRGSYGFVLNTFLPDALSLDASTTALHEWIGIAWYALLR
jgi:uncharacterized SAM-binding protein YcdF (DUF218 family)